MLLNIREDIKGNHIKTLNISRRTAEMVKEDGTKISRNCSRQRCWQNK